MSKKRMLDTKFWSDNYISELDPSEKLLFLYFITNPFTNICGIYEITLRQISLDTGFDRDMILRILNRFQSDGKIYYFSGWVWIKNFLKHQKSSGSVELGINNGLKLIPPEIMAKIKENDGTGGTQGIDSPKLELESELESESKATQIYEETPKETYKTKAKIFKQLGIEYKPKKRTDKQKIAWDTELLARFIEDEAMTLHRIKVFINKSESGKGWKSLKRGIENFGLDECKNIASYYLKSDKFEKYGADVSIMFSEHSINMYLQKNKTNKPKQGGILE